MDFISKKKTFCVITGASRGLGAAIAESLSNVCEPNSTFVLIARNEANLKNICDKLSDDKNNIKIVPIAMDVSNGDFKQFDLMLKPYAQGDFEQAILIHNAASTGDVSKKASELNNINELRDYFDLNFNSMVLLNSAFVNNFVESYSLSRIIVNISSGAAYRGIKALHLYAAGKAARDSFFRIFALEEPSIRILNFNPGALNTDMQRESETAYWAEDTRKWSSDGLQSGIFPTADKAAEVLVTILNKNQYESGSFVNISQRVLQFKSVPLSEKS